MTQLQRDSVDALFQDVSERFAEIMTQLAQYLVDLGDARYRVSDVEERIKASNASAAAALASFKAELRAVLTQEQLERLPQRVLDRLDPGRPSTSTPSNALLERGKFRIDGTNHGP